MNKFQQKTVFILLFLLSISGSIIGQEFGYAELIIDTLCSPAFAGRGYVENGHLKAAEFIRSEMIKMGVQPIDDSYFQEIEFQANTFPKKVEISIDGQPLQTGIDFIVDASCPKIKKEYVLSWGLSNEKIAKNKALLVLDLSNEKSVHSALQKAIVENPSYAGYVVLQEEKFTWSTAQKQIAKPIIYIQKNKIIKGQKEIFLQIDAQVKTVKSNNVIAKITGTTRPNDIVMISAHYDHLGKMGKNALFPGANDNASGIAYLLNLAKHYAQNPPPFTIVFVAFSAEEMGLLGSKFYTEHPLFPLNQIKFLVNLDIMGTGEEGIKVVNATKHTEEFERLVAVNTNNQFLTVVSPRGEAANSDHYFFSEKGVPAFFIYTLGGNPAYHDVNDVPKNLSLSHFAPCFNLLTHFIDGF